jgi:hypothetical protein
MCRCTSTHKSTRPPQEMPRGRSQLARPVSLRLSRCAMVVRLLVALAFSTLCVLAAPAPISIDASAAPTLLSTSAISVFTPYTYYAAVGYCSPAATLAWSCGGTYSSSHERRGRVAESSFTAYCQANSGFKPVASGGDGNTVQHCTHLSLKRATQRS